MSQVLNKELGNLEGKTMNLAKAIYELFFLLEEKQALEIVNKIHNITE